MRPARPPAPPTSTFRASSRRSRAATCAARAQTILDANILGLSCSRVCPVDVLCEGACVMHRYNKQPIEIGRLQRYAMEHFYANGRALPDCARRCDTLE